MIHLQKGDLHKLFRFFFKPGLRLWRIFQILAVIIKFISKNIDVLDLRWLSKEFSSLDSDDRILLCLTMESKPYLIFMIYLKSGRLKRLESIPFADFNISLDCNAIDNIYSIREELEKKYSKLRLVFLIDKKAQNNIIKTVNSSGHLNPIVAYIIAIQEELKMGDFTILPMPAPLKTFICLNAQELMAKFGAIVGMDRKVSFLDYLLIPLRLILFIKNFLLYYSVRKSLTF